MLRLAADENFNMHVINGILRRLPDANIVRVQDAGLTSADDPTVLDWAAHEARVLLTHDANTLTAFAYERIARGLAMPGVFEVSLKVPIGDCHRRNHPADRVQRRWGVGKPSELFATPVINCQRES
jgi:hypothetical protein